MKRLLSLIAVLAIALAGVACDNFFSPTTEINVGQDNSSGVTTPSPAFCQTVVAVEISAPTVMGVGEVAQIDATPLDINGPRPEECDIASGIAWTVVGPCRASSPNVFTPDLFATGAGVCALEAQRALHLVRKLSRCHSSGARLVHPRYRKRPWWNPRTCPTRGGRASFPGGGCRCARDGHETHGGSGPSARGSRRTCWVARHTHGSRPSQGSATVRTARGRC